MIFGFELYRRRAITNLNKSIEYAKKEIEIHNKLQAHLAKELKISEPKKQISKETTELLNNENKDIPKLERKRLRYQRVGEQRIGKIAHELRQTSAVGIGNQLQSINNISEAIHKQYEKDFSTMTLQDAIKCVRLIIEALNNHITRTTTLINLLSGKQIRKFVCELTVKSASGEIVIDTTALVDISSKLKSTMIDIRKFIFTQRHQIVIVDQVTSELPGVLHGYSIPDTISKDVQRMSVSIKPNQDEINQLTRVWLAAKIAKSIHAFQDTARADINVLTYALRCAKDNKQVTVVSNDKDIRDVAIGLRMKQITALSSSSLVAALK